MLPNMNTCKKERDKITNVQRAVELNMLDINLKGKHMGASKNPN